LSLGDRFCLALAKRLSAPAYTADKTWKDIASDVGAKVVVIR
jgi:PIN domain nuclease of toxin-antitoxin system